MKKAIVHNTHQVPDNYIDKSSSGFTTLLLGKVGGLERLYANIDRVLPGANSCKFHSHSHQEEFFMVLNGSGVLRVGKDTYQLEQGDFFCKPAGHGIAHQFINDSNEILEILDVGLPHPKDVVEYPDDGVTFTRETGQAFKDGHLVEEWSSDPNQNSIGLSHGERL